MRITDDDPSWLVGMPTAQVVAHLAHELTIIKQVVEQAIVPSLHDWMTLDEIALKIGRSKRYVQEQVASGSLLSVEPGKVSKRHYERWLEERDRAAEERLDQVRVIPAAKRPKRRSSKRSGN